MIYGHRHTADSGEPCRSEEAQRFPWELSECISAAGAAGHDHVGDPRAGRREQAGRGLRREHARIRAIRTGGTPKHINKWLADNCFGDYYTRGGLDTPRARKWSTLCFLAAQGGCVNRSFYACQGEYGRRYEKAFLIAVVFRRAAPAVVSGYPVRLNARD